MEEEREFVVSSAKVSQNLQDKPPRNDGCGGMNVDDGKKQTVLFRDKLLRSATAAPQRENVDLLGQKLAKLELVEGNRLKPMVYLSDSVMHEICKPWHDALVIKLLGENIGYATMKEMLVKIWKTRKDFDIIDVGNGFFMVDFESEIDRSMVMNGGPWMISDHYLAVQTWSPQFASPGAMVEKTLVWVRFPDLNIVYYNESVLFALASAIGVCVEVDMNTLDVHKGRFVRVCVEVDLSQPVVENVGLNDHWYKVEYEGPHIICGECGCYGHVTRNCTNNKKNVESVDKSTLASDSGTMDPQSSSSQAPKKAEQCTNPAGETVTPSQSLPVNNVIIINDNEESVPVHGERLVVHRKIGNGKTKHNGSSSGVKDGMNVANIQDRGKAEPKPINKKVAGPTKSVVHGDAKNMQCSHMKGGTSAAPTKHSIVNNAHVQSTNKKIEKPPNMKKRRQEEEFQTFAMKLNESVSAMNQVVRVLNKNVKVIQNEVQSAPSLMELQTEKT